MQLLSECEPFCSPTYVTDTRLGLYKSKISKTSLCKKHQLQEDFQASILSRQDIALTFHTSLLERSLILIVSVWTMGEPEKIIP